jgi:hypothetical protein
MKSMTDIFRRLILRCQIRAFLPLLVLGSCSPAPATKTAKAPMTQPSELVGRWVRLREDSTWGDTLQYLSDGRVLGSSGHSVPSSARWGVRAGLAGTKEFCAADEKEGYCQTFHLEDSVMVVDGGPSGSTYFRRAH